MAERFPRALLRALRNDLPIDRLIRFHLDLASKERDGYLRFSCPRCGDFHTATMQGTVIVRP